MISVPGGVAGAGAKAASGDGMGAVRGVGARVPGVGGAAVGTTGVVPAAGGVVGALPIPTKARSALIRSAWLPRGTVMVTLGATCNDTAGVCALMGAITGAGGAAATGGTTAGCNGVAGSIRVGVGKGPGRCVKPTGMGCWLAKAAGMAAGVLEGSEVSAINDSGNAACSSISCKYPPDLNTGPGEAADCSAPVAAGISAILATGALEGLVGLDRPKRRRLSAHARRKTPGKYEGGTQSGLRFGWATQQVSAVWRPPHSPHFGSMSPYLLGGGTVLYCRGAWEPPLPG